MEPPRGKTRIVLDTDAYNEVDDQFALAYALLSPERIEVEAIYATPFVNSRAQTPAEGMEGSYDEILRVLERMGRTPADGFVLRGSERYLTGADDALVSPAAEDIVRRAMEQRDEPLWVVGLGCPTNIAAALKIEPAIVDRIVILWIGGQQYHSPSATDFNIKQDYWASSALYDCAAAFVNVPGYLVSEQLRTTIWELERYLKGRSPIADYLFETVQGYYLERRRSEDDPWSKVIWDIATIGFLVNPEWVPTQLAPAPRLNQDMTWTLDDSRLSVRVATRVERDSIYRDMFRKLAAAR